MSDRKKIILAILGALLLEATIILVSEQATALWPTYAAAKPEEEQKLPELTMMDAPPPEQKQDHSYIRTNDDQKSNEKPKEPAFESDKDTAAASEKEGKENAPLPTQEGKENHDTAFKDEDYSLDTKGQAFTRDAGSQSALAQAEQKTQEQPGSTPTPTPTPQPEPTGQEYALLRPTPTPVPPLPNANKQPQRQSAPPTAYRQQQQLSRMQGNIGTRGRSSVAALGTPYGRFQKAMYDAIGSRWYRYVAQHSDLINIGTVTIRFSVFPDGHVEKPRVTTNNSSESLASYSLQAIMDAEIPKMPPEMVSTVPDSGLPIDLSFSYN
jgi:outer membrane biosynthesis protein TonB